MTQPQRIPSSRWQPEASAYLNALPQAVVAVDRDYAVTFVNAAAEEMFGADAGALLPWLQKRQALLTRIFISGEKMHLHEESLPNDTLATVHLTPVMEQNEPVEIILTAETMEGLPTLAASEWKKDATRAAGLMAAMLAHEVKNPLSGISGAAQILKDETAGEHKPLAELICREADRIRDLLTQMEIFTDQAPAAMQPVNIHEVLQYVIGVAESGFARQIQFKEMYDPSLPEVLGRRELLVPLFLNLVKNAAEAMENRPDAVLTLTTSYKSGYRLQQKLPIMVSIEDNGPGITPEMRGKLFEPFCTSKGEGRGLGLAVVAKIAADLGAVVEFDEQKRQGARFNVMLAIA